MRYPDLDVTQFQEGNPDNGTIVRAFFLNSVLGELLAILEIAGLVPLESGDDPEDHSQISSLLQSRFVQQVPADDARPVAGTDGRILVDPDLVAAGQYPFRLWRNGAWEVAPSPFSEDTEVDEEVVEFNDLAHGARGGADLHAIATTDVAGFMSPEAVQLLNTLSTRTPTIWRSPWRSVTQETIQTFFHSLEAIPDEITIQFRASSTSEPRLVREFFDDTNAHVGASVYSITNERIRLALGRWLWVGYTDSGLEKISSGQIRVIASTIGGAQ